MVLAEKTVRRNKRWIRLLALLGVLNYWIGAILMTFAVIVGTILAVVVEGLAEGFDFDLLIGLLRAIPGFVRWFAESVWDATVAGFVGLAFVALGTVVAVVMIVGRVRKVEQRTLGETAAIPAPDPRIRGMLEGLALAAGAAPPGLALVIDPAPNSFSVGRRPETSTVVVTSGAIEKLDRYELEAVLAYELSRVVSRDTALSTWTTAVTGRTIELYERSQRISVSVALAVPVRLARRLQARVLRHQAGQRDVYAISFTRYPQALISALQKMHADGAVVARATSGNAPLWMEYPVVGARPRGVPELGERIWRLQSLVAPGGFAEVRGDPAPPPPSP